MIKWWRGITFKLFLLVFTILVVIVFLIYGVLYFFLPNYYYDYKTSMVIKETDILLRESHLVTFQQFEGKVLEFIENTDTHVSISSINGDLFNFYSKRNDINVWEQSLNEQSIVIDEYPEQNDLQSSTYSDMYSNMYFTTEDNESMYTNTERVKLQGGEVLLHISLPLQSLEDVSQALVKFIPYVVFISFLLAIICALIFSRTITKPFINLQHVAKRMGELDFSKKANMIRKDELGELAGSLNIMATNLENTIVQLNEANSQLVNDIERSKIEEKRRNEFIATISHELKSPITAAMFQLEAMIANVGRYADRDTYLKKTYAILEDMKGLSDEILEITKMEQLVLNSETKKINLSQVIKGSIARQKLYNQNNNINLSIKIPNEFYIKTNERLLTKVIDNVLGNAFKYSTGNKLVIVELKQNDALLSISNQCNLISNEDFKQIFQAFYRIDKSRSRHTGGSGLGLFIVSNILNELNISYSFANQNDGVVFKIDFSSVIGE